MEEVAEELEEMEYHPENGDLIAETKATPDHYTDAQYIESVEFNWSRMGAAGHELFKDLDVPEAVAYRIKSSREWNRTTAAACVNWLIWRTSTTVPTVTP